MSLTKFIRKLRGGMKRKLEEQKSNQVCLDMSQIQTKMLDMLYKKKVVQNALNVGEMVFLIFYFILSFYLIFLILLFF